MFKKSLNDLTFYSSIPCHHRQACLFEDAGSYHAAVVAV